MPRNNQRFAYLIYDRVDLFYPSYFINCFGVCKHICICQGQYSEAEVLLSANDFTVDFFQRMSYFKLRANYGKLNIWSGCWFLDRVLESATSMKS